MPKLSLIMLVVLVMANAIASSAQRSVPAEKIIAKVQNNPSVEYDNVTISGDLDLGWPNQPPSVASFQ
jgi:hypothetical protein